MHRTVFKYLLLIILPVSFFQSGCETNEIDPESERMGYDFYPLATGLYRDYRIQHILHILSQEPDTSNYYLREYVMDSAVNMEGGYTYTLARYTRDSINHDWTLDSLWKAEKNNKFVRVTENNVPYVKLVFPVTEGKSWDGNAYNNLEEKNYIMQNAYIPYQVSDHTYEESVTVIHEYIPDTMVRYINKTEVFAENVGLIYKGYTDLKYCTNNDCYSFGIIENGYEIYQRLIGYGKD